MSGTGMSHDEDAESGTRLTLDPSSWGIAIGGLAVGLARDEEDLAAVQRLRAVRFRGAKGVSDMDRFDPHCLHLLVRKSAQKDVLAAARLRLLAGPVQLSDSYSAQFYDLGVIGRSGQRCMEIGRICIDAAHVHDPDILRAVLAGLTRLSLQTQADMLVGCASFRGADPERHSEALAYLAANHIGPETLRPGQGAEHILPLPNGTPTDATAGLKQVPALLRLYLGLGGWVSDHAVIDRDLDTLHVFAAVETAAIPPKRLRALHLLARG